MGFVVCWCSANKTVMALDDTFSEGIDVDALDDVSKQDASFDVPYGRIR